MSILCKFKNHQWKVVRKLTFAQKTVLYCKKCDNFQLIEYGNIVKNPTSERINKIISMPKEVDYKVQCKMCGMIFSQSEFLNSSIGFKGYLLKHIQQHNEDSDFSRFFCGVKEEVKK